MKKILWKKYKHTEKETVNALSRVADPNQAYRDLFRGQKCFMQILREGLTKFLNHTYLTFPWLPNTLKMTNLAQPHLCRTLVATGTFGECSLNPKTKQPTPNSNT